MRTLRDEFFEARLTSQVAWLFDEVVYLRAELEKCKNGCKQAPKKASNGQAKATKQSPKA